MNEFWLGHCFMHDRAHMYLQINFKIDTRVESCTQC